MKKQDKIEIKIEFGGFYDSIHSYWIDRNIDSNYNNLVEYEKYDYDNIDYEKTNYSYIKDYCNKFNSYIFNEYKINIDFENIGVKSPKFYNFSTDVIHCDIDIKQSKKLINHFYEDSEFLEYLKDRTTSYDGFMSFYTYNQALNNKDNILIDYLLDFLANEFNEKVIIYGEIEFDIYFINENFKFARAKQ